MRNFLISCPVYQNPTMTFVKACVVSSSYCLNFALVACIK